MGKTIRVFFCVSLFFIAGVASAQTVVKEQVLSTLKSPDQLEAYGIKSLYKSDPTENAWFTAGFELVDLKEEGFICRDNYHVTKYNNKLEKLWEADLEKEFSVMNRPYGKTVGNKYGAYFFEHSLMRKIKISQLNSDGKVVSKLVNLKGVYNNFMDAYVDSEGFNIIMYVQEVKSVKYQLMTYSHKDLTETITELELPHDDFEIKKRPVPYMNVYWRVVGTEDGRILFAKAYPKIENGTKYASEFVLKTAEYNRGKALQFSDKEFSMISYKNLSVSQTNLIADLKNNAFYLYGLISSEESKTIDKAYVHKYDLNSSKPLYTKELSLMDIKNTIPPNDHINSIVNEKNISINPKLDEVNNYFRIDLSKNYLEVYAVGHKYSSKDNWRYAISLSDKGDVAKIEEFSYAIKPELNEGYDMVPLQYSIVYQNPSIPSKALPELYIWKKADGTNKEETIWKVLYRKDNPILLFYNDKTGELIARKMEM